MKLTGTNNEKIEFEIINYQFPDEKGNGSFLSDANWLKIYQKITTEQYEVENLDAAYLTGDIWNIINWFTLLSDNIMPKSKELSFFDTNQTFTIMNEATDEHKLIRIRYTGKLNATYKETNEELFIFFSLNNAELKEAARELQIDLDLFPER